MCLLHGTVQDSAIPVDQKTRVTLYTGGGVLPPLPTARNNTRKANTRKKKKNYYQIRRASVAVFDNLKGDIQTGLTGLSTPPPHPGATCVCPLLSLCVCPSVCLYSCMGVWVTYHDTCGAASLDVFHAENGSFKIGWSTHLSTDPGDTK